jgi:hypothetical protein
MRSMERAFGIAFFLCLALTGAVIGVASLLEIPEKWNGSLFLLCVAIGTIVLCVLVDREDGYSKRK